MSETAGERKPSALVVQPLQSDRTSTLAHPSGPIKHSGSQSKTKTKGHESVLGAWWRGKGRGRRWEENDPEGVICMCEAGNG